MSRATTQSPPKVLIGRGLSHAPTRAPKRQQCPVKLHSMHILPATGIAPTFAAGTHTLGRGAADAPRGVWLPRVPLHNHTINSSTTAAAAPVTNVGPVELRAHVAATQSCPLLSGRARGTCVISCPIVDFVCILLPRTTVTITRNLWKRRHCKVQRATLNNLAPPRPLTTGNKGKQPAA